MAERIENISRVNLRMRRGAVVLGEILYAPGGICGPRVQHDYQLVIMHRGTLDLQLDGDRIKVPAGHAILLSPNHREHFIFARDEETRHSWCAIRPEAIPAAIRKQLRRNRGPLPFVGRMAALLELIRNADAGEEDSLQEAFYLGLGLGLLCDFALTARERHSPPGTGEKSLQRLDQFIRSEYTQSLTLGDMARAARVSKQHLLRLCRLEGKGTPIEQLYLRRLEVAADLLSHTGLSVGEIAERCGFANPFHFSRKFKQAYRTSPLNWRKELWTRNRPGKALMP